MKPQYRNQVNLFWGLEGIYTSSGDFASRLPKKLEVSIRQQEENTAQKNPAMPRTDRIMDHCPVRLLLSMGFGAVKAVWKNSRELTVDAGE